MLKQTDKRGQKDTLVRGLRILVAAEQHCKTEHQNARSHSAFGPKLQAAHAIFLSTRLPLALYVSSHSREGADDTQWQQWMLCC